MSDSPGRSADRVPGVGMRFTVDVVLHRLRTRTATDRTERVVLRRTVVTVLPDMGEARVEELWTSAAAAHVQPVLAVVRGIGDNARRLVLGEPVGVPDLAPVTGPVVDELAELVDRAGGGGGAVDRVLGFRGTVDVDGGSRTLAGGELVCPAPGLLSRPVRSAFRRVINELGCTAADEPGGDPKDGDPKDGGEPAGAGAAAATPDVAEALRTDLRAARRRDDQHALWRSLAGARLGPPVEAPAGAHTPEPVFVHWPRRAAASTAPAVPDDDRTDLHSVVVTFVEIAAVDVEGLRIGQRDRQLDLFSYRLDARIDLQAVVEQDGVRAAFAAYAAAGGTDPGLRDPAVGALPAAGAPAETDRRRHERRIDPLGGASSGAVEWLGGTVVFTDCRDIQVGNDLRRYATFACAVAPTAHTVALLRDHPDLVGSIVDHACRVDGAPRNEVQRRLHAAVCGSDGEDLVGEVSRAVGRVVESERRRVEEAEQRRLREERRRRPNPLLPPNLLVEREPDDPEPDGPEPDGPEPDGPEPDGPEPDGPEPDGPEPTGPDHDERDIGEPGSAEPAEPAVVPEPRVLGRPAFYPEIEPPTEPDSSRRNGRSFGH